MFVQTDLQQAALRERNTLRWRHLGRSVRLCAVSLVLLTGLFITLQALTFTFTHNKGIMRRIDAAANEHILNGQNFPLSIYGHSGLNYDMFTECLTLSINLGNEDRPLLYRLAATPYIKGSESDPCGILLRDVSAMRIEAEQPYLRYWHGALVYLRPLLANTSLANVHIITALLLIGTLSAFVLELANAFGRGAAILLIVSLIACTNVLTVPAATVHALTWIWAFASLAVMTRYMARGEINASGPLTLAFVFGCVAAFFDVLFSPPFTPTLMAFLAIAFGLQRKSVPAAIYDAVVIGFFWFLGFSLSWASKWVFATIVLGWDVVQPNLLPAISYRSVVGISTLPVEPALDRVFVASRLAIASQNVEFILGAAALASAMFAVSILMARDKLRVVVQTLALLLPMLVPFIWIELMRGHSLGHTQFAARSLVHLALIPLLAAYLDLYPHIERHGRSIWLASRARNMH